MPATEPRPTTLAACTLTREAVEAWPANLLATGARVVAPVATSADQVEYRELSPAAATATGLGRGLPRLSPKSAWFPRSEPILQLRRQGRQWALDDPDLTFPRVVVCGARPCDAAAPGILAPLFGWDFHDVFFERRLANVALIVMACAQPVDRACFCTSVGIDPAGEAVGDILLTPLAGDQFFAEARTPEGQKLLTALTTAAPTAGVPDSAALQARREQIRHSVPVRFDAARVRHALGVRFDDPLWEQSSRYCVACGTCAFACPTCHCFDIQDEPGGAGALRQKNWDTCASPLFTLHTSGHNPRPDQAARWRQRLSHKFRYYPEKFSRVLCTGCGRCMRLCPAGMDLLADLENLAQTPLAAAPATVQEQPCRRSRPRFPPPASPAPPPPIPRTSTTPI